MHPEHESALQESALHTPAAIGPACPPQLPSLLFYMSCKSKTPSQSRPALPARSPHPSPAAGRAADTALHHNLSLRPH